MRVINELMINKRASFIIEKENDQRSKEQIQALQVSAAQLGFILAPELVQAFASLSEESFQENSAMLLELLKIQKGADVDMDDFLFPNFPRECRMKSLEELSSLRFAGYLADLLGYIFEEKHARRFLGLGKYTEHTERTPLELDLESMDTITLGTMDDFYSTSCNLLGSRMALSRLDRQLLTQIFTQNSWVEKQRMIPEEIPFKETLAFLVGLQQKVDFNLQLTLKSFVDVKRVYAALLDRKIDIQYNFRLGNLKNQTRKWLLVQMERGLRHYYQSFLESAYKEREFVVLFWNRIHPEKYQSVAPRSVALLRAIKEGEKVETQAAKLERLLHEGRGLEAAKLAIQNPGNAVRRLAHLLSRCKDLAEGRQAIALIGEKAAEVDASVLLNAKCALDHYIPEKIRAVFPQGKTDKVRLVADHKTPIKPELVQEASQMLEQALVQRFAAKSPLGKVYIADNMASFHIPFGSRDESAGYRIISRGSRMKVEQDTDVLRFFVYKKIPRMGGFVDLSVTFLNKFFEGVTQCSWTNLKVEELAMHSGDSSNCQEGLSEYVDVCLEGLKKNPDIRYVVMQIFSYSHIPFNQMERCFAGLMLRKDMPNDGSGDFNGRVFEPSTVRYRMDLTDDSVTSLPLIYDVKNEEVVWCDMSIRGGFSRAGMLETLSTGTEGNVIPGAGTLTLENVMPRIATACYAAVHMKKPSLKELVELNVKARGGELVTDPTLADIVVAEDGTLTPFQRDIITKEWL
ncbi:MAG: hypothetical protein IJ315_04525 [Firmicutes bacterium]|nr:hypothetical protein [Bacillota bacterium]